MRKRELQRYIRKLLRALEMSPETFATRYRAEVYGASGRTVRRWCNGQSAPHPAVVDRLRALSAARTVFPEAE